MSNFATSAAPPLEPALLTPGMRRMLLAASGLVFLVGIQLFILTERTDEFFAWHVQPPLTAAFLGANYWASCLMELLAARQRTWAQARVAVPAVLLFTTLTLIASLLHLDRFRLDSVAAWGWLAVYGSVPAIMGTLWILQRRAAGVDPPRTEPFPPGLCLVLAIQAGLMLGLGVILFVAPLAATDLWPWKLTPLTGRVTGAWLIGLGVFVAHVGWERDWARTRPAPPSLTLLGALQFLALARYPATLDWTRPSIWVFTLAVGSLMGVGLYGLIRQNALVLQPLARAEV
jgi:hypothetical protein